MNEFIQSQLQVLYNNIAYGKTESSLVCAIPDGTSACLWFTDKLYNKPACFRFEHLSNKQICVESIVQVPIGIHADLLKNNGTLICGTQYIFPNNGRTYFTIESVTHYCGNNILQLCWGEKLKILDKLLNYQLDQTLAKTTHTEFMIIGLPLICKTLVALEHKISNGIVGVPIKYILMINLQTPNASNYYYKDKNNDNISQNIQKNVHKDVESSQTFLVKTTPMSDIYHLFTHNKITNIPEYYGIAGIPNLKTSILVNKIFNPENKDEDDECDLPEQKTEANIVCVYNYEFKKWYPKYESIL